MPGMDDAEEMRATDEGLDILGFSQVGPLVCPSAHLPVLSSVFSFNHSFVPSFPAHQCIFRASVRPFVPSFVQLPSLPCVPLFFHRFVC